MRWGPGLPVLAALCTGCLSLSIPGRSHRGALPPPDDGLAASAARVEATIERLAGEIGVRTLVVDRKALAEAAGFVHGELSAQGWEVRRQEVRSDRGPSDNVIARWPGASGPSVVVGAHVDTFWATPGADDNASGVAALLEIGRALAGTPTAPGVTLIAWTNEEPPWFGTDAMGSRVHAASDPDVRLAISLETIGLYATDRRSQRYPFPLSVAYPNRGDFVTFVGNVRSRRLVRDIGRRFRAAEPFPSRGGAGPGWITGLGWSDHASYWRHGVPAVMVTDTALFRNPRYHEPSDTPETVDPVAIARVARGMAFVVTGLVASERYAP